MKTAIPTKAARLFLALTALALLLVTGQSQAQETWIGGVDNTTGTAGNWTPSQPAAASTSNVVLFDSATNLAPNNNYLTGVGELRFSANSSGMVLGGSSLTAGRATITNSGALTKYGANTSTIDLNVQIRANNATPWRNVFVDSGGTLIINGVISSTHAFDVVKTSTGTLVLNAANIYTGITRNNGGAIFINNTSGNGAAEVVNSTAGTIGGSGSFSGNYSGGGTISPGATGSQVIGTLTAGANVDWGPSSSSQRSWEFNLGTAAASLALAESGSSMQDQLVIGGNFTKNTSSGGDYQFDFLGGGEEGWYKLVDWAGTTGFSASDFDALNLDSGLTGSFTIDNDALYLNVIPEPSSVGLLLGGLGALALLRRRRRS
jgi:autotransporter-associated beta strand protein